MPVQRSHELALREVPLLVGAELVVGTRRELRPRLEPEQAVEVPEVVERPVELRFDLLARAEDARVVLRHVADPRQPVQRAGELVPVQWSRLGVAQRADRGSSERAAEEEHVPGAVHRLDPIDLLVEGIRNMFSLNFSQWPEVSQSALS